jgi:hypothetical protein
MEKAFNLFVYTDGKFIHSLGYVCYLVDRDDSSLLELMRSSVGSDYTKAREFKLEASLLYEDFFSSMRLGTHLYWFEEIFQLENAPHNPLVVVTPVVNGKPKIDHITDQGPFSFDELEPKHAGFTGAPDYLKSYMVPDGFDMSRLINDDYFKAYKLVYNAGYYVSATKLLLSCIDSLAFIEEGDNGIPFIAWLCKYADLSSHGISAEELWELRNGLLHMTNLSSRAVQAGKHPSIVIYSGGIKEIYLPKTDETFKYLNLYDFYRTIGKATEKWISTYQEIPEKMIDFVKRYDLTVSDSRMAVAKS